MAYLTKQRTRNGVVERQCRYCSAWWQLDKFVKTRTPWAHNGRLAKCKPCYNDDRRVTRTRAA